MNHYARVRENEGVVNKQWRRQQWGIRPLLRDKTAGWAPHAVVFLLDKSTEINDICHVHEGLKNYWCSI